MKHTKGNWEVSSTFLVVDENGKLISQCLLAGLPDSLLVTPEEAEANAKLIAAAPDLLEALNKIKDLCDGNITNENNIWHLCNKAIKKATA